MTWFCVNPNYAHVFFEFVDIHKCGMKVCNLAADANDEDVANLVYDFVGVADSNDG